VADATYNKLREQKAFANLVSARLAELISGNAEEYAPEPPPGKAFITREQEDRVFADVVARTLFERMGEDKWRH